MNDDHDESPQVTDQSLISLNVGGTIYQVSRSLLEEQHPETMLARLVSETWHHEPRTEIFIERNGTRFQFVLDYLRDGSVDLPLSVSKAAFLKDLDYFGIAHDETRIHGVGTVAAVVALGLEEAEALRKVARSAKEKADYCQLANELFAEYCRSGRLKFSSQWITEHTDFDQPPGIQRQMLSPHMKKFGMEVRSDPQSDWEGCLVLGHLDHC